CAAIWAAAARTGTIAPPPRRGRTPPERTMRFNLRQNLYLKIFSLMLAVVCWYVVRSEEERVRDFAVPLEYVGLPSGLELSGRAVDAVAIRLRAPEPVLGSITEDRLAARISLAHASP